MTEQQKTDTLPEWPRNDVDELVLAVSQAWRGPMSLKDLSDAIAEPLAKIIQKQIEDYKGKNQ